MTSKRTPKEKSRITLKTTLAKAVETIASNKILTQSETRRHWILEVDKGAAKLLLIIAARDANEGWAVLYGLDRMNIYGTQIRDAFNYYCQGDIDIFIRCARGQDERLNNWINRDEQRPLPS